MIPTRQIGRLTSASSSLKLLFAFGFNGARGRNRITDTRIFNPTKELAIMRITGEILQPNQARFLHQNSATQNEHTCSRILGQDLA